MTANSATAAAESRPNSERSESLPQAAPLPASQLAIIKATVPVLQQHGEAITKVMYDSLISDHPDLRDVFSSTSQTTGRQPRALARAVLCYATYIDDLPKLAHAVERIAQKHVSLFVRPEQYDVVGTYLIGAIGTVLGEAATPDIVEAWTAAYGVLAQVFIGREKALYLADGTWAEWRDFRIAKKVVEATDIVSFWLSPVDDGVGPLPRFLPGQYISVQADVPTLGHKQSRQFSLSNEPGAQFYRVSVKRERPDSTVAQKEDFGIVSNLLHDAYQEGDAVAVSHPHGEFFLDPSDALKESHPVVLVSAGVGATPLVSMLKALSAPTAVKRPVSWIHTARSREAQPFRDEVATAVDSLQAKGVRVETLVHLTHDSEARLDIAELQKDNTLFVNDTQAEYFVCGPEDFMVQCRKKLIDLGVGKERIHLELFATGDVEDE